MQGITKHMQIHGNFYYIIQLARATAYLHKMGCCQSEIEKHYLKGKFDKMILFSNI